MAIDAKQLWLSDELESSADPLESWCVCRKCFDGCAAFRDECADYLACVTRQRLGCCTVAASCRRLKPYSARRKFYDLVSYWQVCFVYTEQGK